MQRALAQFNQLDKRITEWMAKFGPVLLRVSVGIVFLWFGFLKFFPGLSPAQELAGRTIEILSFGFVKPAISVPMLAALETIIGLGMIFGIALRAVIFLLFFQMLGTLTPLFLFPSEVFTRVPYAPTLEGQYIIKNLVLISAALVIGATVRGGRMVASRKAAGSPAR